MSNHNTELKNLICETTVFEIKDRKINKTIFKLDQNDPETSKDDLENKQPYNFSLLEPNWDKKWKSYGNIWSTERQSYRYLWSETRFFTESYLLYKENLNEEHKLRASNNPHTQIFSNRSELSIRSMYEYGKQAIDILYLISKTDEKTKKHIQPHTKFLKQFKGTRNIFLTHYHNLYSYTLLPDPIFSSLESNSALFEIRIHVPDKEEHKYTAKVNHYADYFKLEEILRSLIETY